MDFVVIDQSTSATEDAAHGGPITNLPAIAAAMQVQLDRDVAASYGGSARVRAGAGPSDVAPAEIVALIVDDLPDPQPGAIAYHSVDGSSHPLVYVGRTDLTSVSVGSMSVTAALSHELVETFCDAACNLWADDGQGHEWAREACDATESDTYEIDGIAVSNFLLPNFFAPGAPAPWTYLGSIGDETVPGPFGTARGGYQMQRATDEGNETQVTGQIRPHRLGKMRHPSSRAYRRGARV